MKGFGRACGPLRPMTMMLQPSGACTVVGHWTDSTTTSEGSCSHLWRSTSIPDTGVETRAGQACAWPVASKLQGLDLNQRPQGYEPCELPGCSTLRSVVAF